MVFELCRNLYCDDDNRDTLEDLLDLVYGLYVEVIAHESVVGSNQPDKKKCRMF